MEKTDRVLSLKDWVESFWAFQEEDFSFFQELLQKKRIFDPEGILQTIKHRMKARKAFYQFYKYLSWKDVPANEVEDIKKRVEEVLYREELITEMVNKLLEVLSLLVESPEDGLFFKEIPPQEKHTILH